MNLARTQLVIDELKKSEKDLFQEEREHSVYLAKKRDIKVAVPKALADVGT